MLDHTFWALFNKSTPIVLEALALGLVFKKPKVSSIFMISLIFICILSVILVAGYFDLEFFFILFFLIYISALLILFLFALLFLPVDKRGAEKREGLNTLGFCGNILEVTTLSAVSSTIDLSLLVFTGYIINRIVDLRSCFVNLFFSGNFNSLINVFTFNYFKPGASTWLTSYEICNATRTSELELFTRSATAISAASYQEYSIALFAVVLVLLMVLVGTLSWFKRTETLEN